MKFGIILLIHLIYQLKFGGTINCSPHQCVRHPTYISNWTRMTAQDNVLSELVIQHNLNEIPVKVDVQVKQITGNDTDFIFSGIGSSQRDDDYDSIYGGIVYMYDSTSVKLIAPNKNDGLDKGTIIFTGDGIWKGSSNQNDQEAYVRVRVWHPCDFSAPDFVSSWKPIESNQASKSFFEVPHGLGLTPEYVSVQIRLGNTDYISDGIGCSMTHKNTNTSTSWGGVLYGYDSTNIRIWLPGSPSGSIFSASDGWGFGSNYNWKNGHIKITAYKKIKTVRTNDKEFPVTIATSNEHLQAAISAVNGGKSINVDTDIFEMLVKPKNGSNKDYYFKASGVAQNAERTGKYGGLVYSYSESFLRMYHPAFAESQYPHNGYLLYINELWGNGRYKQQTNHVKLVTHTWTTFKSCPIPTTTTTATTTTTTQTTTTTKSTTTTTPITTTTTTTTTTMPTTTTAPSTTATTPTTTTMPTTTTAPSTTTTMPTTTTTPTTTTVPTTTTTTPTTKSTATTIPTTTEPVITTTTPTTTTTSTTTTTPTTTTTIPATITTASTTPFATMPTTITIPTTTELTTTTTAPTTTTTTTTTTTPTTTTTMPSTTTTPTTTTTYTTMRTTTTSSTRTTSTPRTTTPTTTTTTSTTTTTPATITTKSTAATTIAMTTMPLTTTMKVTTPWPTTLKPTSSKRIVYNLKAELEAERKGGLSSSAKALLGVAGSLLLLAGLLCLLVALLKRKKRKKKKKKTVVEDIRTIKYKEGRNYNEGPNIDDMAFI